MIAAQDIQLQKILLINRIDIFKTKESLFFLCVRFFLISNMSCVAHVGQSCFPLEAIYVIYHKALFVQIFFFSSLPPQKKK